MYICIVPDVIIGILYSSCDPSCAACVTRLRQWIYNIIIVCHTYEDNAHGTTTVPKPAPRSAVSGIPYPGRVYHLSIVRPSTCGLIYYVSPFLLAFVPYTISTPGLPDLLNVTQVVEKC